MHERTRIAATGFAHKNLVIAVMAVVAGVLAFLALDSYLDTLKDRANWDEVVGNMRLVLIAASVLLALSSLTLGAILWRVGTHTITQAHYPPLGDGITSERELDGEPARKTGRLLHIGGEIIAAVGLVAAVVGFLVATL